MELLGWEAEGEHQYFDGRLRKRFSLPQLLDGYESVRERQARQVDDLDDAPLDHLHALLQTNEGHLRQYELQAAGYGSLNVPPFIPIQIMQLREENDRILKVIQRRSERVGR